MPAGRSRSRRAGGPAGPFGRIVQRRRSRGPAAPSGRGAGTRAGRTDGRLRPGAAKRAAEPKPPLSPPEQAREICLRLLSFRPRTRAELAAALRQRGIEDDVAAEVLDRYSDVGMIDDRGVRPGLGDQPAPRRGLARRALAGELRRKGVDAESVDAALDELDPTPRRPPPGTWSTASCGPTAGDRPTPCSAGWSGMLARKGYPAGLAIRVVKDALAERAEPTADERSS